MHRLTISQNESVFVICKPVSTLCREQNFDRKINTIFILKYMILSFFVLKFFLSHLPVNIHSNRWSGFRDFTFTVWKT